MSNQVNTDKSQFRLKIFPRILLGNLVIPIIGLIALLILINFMKNEQTAALEKNLVTNTSLAVNQVDDWIDKNVRLSKYVASLDGIKSMDPLQQKPLLQAAQKSTEWMTLMFVVNIRVKRLQEVMKKKLVNYSDREYFKNAIATKKNWRAGTYR